ncbi:MAG TPA: hypothetical protein VKM56_07880 [Verrucomicrobiae bacterium]|nr:hypothetical protein [Verrucomicrobiae bacterium]
MDRKGIIENKLFATAKAATYGVVFFGGIVILDNFAYQTLGKGSGLLTDIVTSLAWLLALPAIALGANNALVVDALFGALLFGIPAFFWQFVVKDFGKE